jgi:GH24 family phage-related lysozyme (muramidase)
MKDLKFMADEGQTLEQALLECVERHGADIKVVKDTNVRLNRSTTRKERAAIVDFSRFVIGNNLCVKDASELIRRDRSNIYHYAGCR